MFISFAVSNPSFVIRISAGNDIQSGSRFFHGAFEDWESTLANKSRWKISKKTEEYIRFRFDISISYFFFLFSFLRETIVYRKLSIESFPRKVWRGKKRKSKSVGTWRRTKAVNRSGGSGLTLLFCQKTHPLRRIEPSTFFILLRS